eukprot:scaffold425029_cov20-Prasinocladus_malaysianus.AAC.1
MGIGMVGRALHRDLGGDGGDLVADSSYQGRPAMTAAQRRGQHAWVHAAQHLGTEDGMQLHIIEQAGVIVVGTEANMIDYQDATNIDSISC